MSYIDRTELKKKIYDLKIEDEKVKFNEVIRAINNTPAEEVTPIKHGKWIFETLSHHDIMTCSNCRTIHEYQDGTFEYCPYCGSKMDLESGEGR